MKSSSWKKFMGVGLSVFTLFISSWALTGCEVGGEGEELEQEEAPLEQEED